MTHLVMLNKKRLLIIMKKLLLVYVIILFAMAKRLIHLLDEGRTFF